MLKAIMESSARSFKFDEILGLNKTVVEYNTEFSNHEVNVVPAPLSSLKGI